MAEGIAAEASSRFHYDERFHSVPALANDQHVAPGWARRDREQPPMGASVSRSDPPEVDVGVCRDAHADPPAAGRVDHAQSELDVADLDCEETARWPEVPGLVDRPKL